jgi:hypothetical protein
MKTINMHFTQTKKSYKKPVLNKLGKVSKLTKSEKGSTSSDFPLPGGDEPGGA